MLRYVDSVLTPYLTGTRAELGLPPDQIALIICDVFAAHRCDSFLNKCAANHVKVIYVPAGCTGELQPLDVTVNQIYKVELKASFYSLVCRTN